MSTTYDDWRADFQSNFHILKPASKFAACLQPEPVPACYADSQALARTLLNNGSNGLIYPSVRRKGFDCLVCFRPALVYNPRRSDRYELTLTAATAPAGYTHQLRKVSLKAGTR